MKNEIRELEGAINRTIEETQKEAERQRVNGVPNPTTLMNMNDYRRFQEAQLNYYELTHPGPIKTFARAIVGSTSYILAPVILAGGLVYFGGRGIINHLKNKRGVNPRPQR